MDHVIKSTDSDIEEKNVITLYNNIIIIIIFLACTRENPSRESSSRPCLFRIKKKKNENKKKPTEISTILFCPCLEYRCLFPTVFSQHNCVIRARVHRSSYSHTVYVGILGYVLFVFLSVPLFLSHSLCLSTVLSQSYFFYFIDSPVAGSDKK